MSGWVTKEMEWDRALRSGHLGLTFELDRSLGGGAPLGVAPGALQPNMPGAWSPDQLQATMRRGGGISSKQANPHDKDYANEP